MPLDSYDKIKNEFYSFTETFELLEKEIGKPINRTLKSYLAEFHDNGQLYGVPSIVNAAFAVELGLKALIIKSGNQYDREHNFDLLFALLPKKEQDSIKFYFFAESRTDEQTFYDLLDKTKNAFIEWRYIFESDGGKTIRIAFLRNFIRILKSHLEKS